MSINLLIDYKINGKDDTIAMAKTPVSSRQCRLARTLLVKDKHSIASSVL
jgi:hypothetical protein